MGLVHEEKLDIFKSNIPFFVTVFIHICPQIGMEAIVVDRVLSHGGYIQHFIDWTNNLAIFQVIHEVK